jgi:hypothetical protein
MMSYYDGKNVKDGSAIGISNDPHIAPESPNFDDCSIVDMDNHFWDDGIMWPGHPDDFGDNG